MKTHKCSICGKNLPLTKDFFYVRKNRSSGFRSECKECVRKSSVKWGQNNPNKKKIKAQKYNAKAITNLSEAYIIERLSKIGGCSRNIIRMLPYDYIYLKKSNLKLVRNVNSNRTDT